jgi:hypothetical protein
VLGATVILLLLRFTVAYKGNRNASAANNCPHDKGLPTYEQWRQRVVFPYTASEEKLRRVKDNYDHVGIGSSKNEIIEAFGLPDFEEELSPKEPNRPCTGYEFRYYFEKPEEMTNELNDKAIAVFFTPSGEAEWIVGNVGLAEKGGPARRPE